MSPKRSRKQRKQSSSPTNEEESVENNMRKSPKKKSSKRGDSGTSLDAERQEKSKEPDFNWRKHIDSDSKRGKSEKKKRDRAEKARNRPKSPADAEELVREDANVEMDDAAYEYEPTTTKEVLKDKYKSLEQSVRKGRSDGALGVLDADVTTSKKASKTFAALDNSPRKRASTGDINADSKANGTSDYNWEDHPKDYSWEKPEWAKKSALKKTGRGASIKQGTSLAAPVTHINANKDESRDTNPLANTSRLRHSTRGSIAKQGVSLSAPVTHINANKDESRDTNPLANTSRLRRSTRGSIAKQGVSLSAPVTHINANKDESRDTNQLVDKKKLRKQRRATHAGTNTEWEKPDWVKSSCLKSSEVGSSARQGKSLALPVTKIAEVVSENELSNLAWQKPEWAQGGKKLKPSKKRR